jgi:cell division protein FtsW
MVPNIDSIAASILGLKSGIIGVLSFLLLFSAMIISGIKIIRKIAAKDPQELLLMKGILFLLSVTCVLHICVCLGVFPLRRVSLPFLSYNNSFQLAVSFLLGIFLQIAFSSVKYFSINWGDKR